MKLPRPPPSPSAPAIAGAEQQRAMRKPPASLDAWGAYQRGMWHLGKVSAEDNEIAESFFQRAVDLDPMFVGGFIGLAAVLSRAKGTQDREEAMARRAVALDGGDAEAHSRLALALVARGDHSGARAQAERALAICPNLAEAHGAARRRAGLFGAAKRRPCGARDLHSARSPRAVSWSTV